MKFSNIKFYFIVVETIFRLFYLDYSRINDKGVYT